MNQQTRRLLLAPVRQWRTRRLMRQQGSGLDYETAWALIALRHAPDEFAFVRQSAREADTVANAGINHDDWSRLSAHESDRRRRWLIRHEGSPIQQLGLTPALIERAGISVVDWGRQSDGS